MNKEAQVQICKQCKNKKLDLKKGILCGLTGRLPDFQDKCNMFSPKDESYKQIAARIEQKDIEEKLNRRGLRLATTIEDLKKVIHQSANLFYLIAGLSVLNTIAVFTDFSYTFFVGLGISQFIDEIIFNNLNIHSIIGIMPGIVVASIFASIGIYANQYKRIAFLIGIILYIFDASLFLFSLNWLPIIFHVFIIILLIKGYNAISKYEEKIENTPSSI